MIFETTKWLQCCRASYSHRRLSTFRFILSGFYTRSLSLLNSHCTPFASVLSGFSTNTALSVSCLFPSFETRVPKRPWPGSRRPFPRNYPLKKKTGDTLMYPTMPRLSRHCLWFDRYLRSFVHDTTFGHPAITSALRCGLQFRYRRMRRLRRWGPKASWSRRSSMCAQAPHAPAPSPPCIGHSTLFVIPGTDLKIFPRVLNLGQIGFS